MHGWFRVSRQKQTAWGRFPSGTRCSRPHIGQETHSSTSYHALHSLFPKALATSLLNLTCLWPLSCSKTRRGVHVLFPSPCKSNCQIELWALENFFGMRDTLDEFVESMVMEQPLGITRGVAMWCCWAPSLFTQWQTWSNCVQKELLRKVCVTCISCDAGSPGHITSVCARLWKSGAHVSAEERPRVEVCAACPVRRVCKRGHNTRVGWLGFLGAGCASMAAKRPSLRWQPEVHCVPEWKDSWENSHWAQTERPLWLRGRNAGYS